MHTRGLRGVRGWLGGRLGGRLGEVRRGEVFKLLSWSNLRVVIRPVDPLSFASVNSLQFVHVCNVRC